MSEWIQVSLIEYIELIGGGTPKTTVPEYWNGDIPWLSVKDFNNDNRYVYATEKKISKSGLANSSTKLLQKDDIIISARGTVGEIAMIPYPMAFNQSCYGVRAKDGIDSVFLYYLLKNSINQIKRMTHGSVFDTITRDTFENLFVKIPDIEEQKKIATVLLKLDDKIELNQKINDNLLQQAQALYQSWFVDYAPFDGIMPDTWHMGTLSDLADTIICGKTPSTKRSEYYGNEVPFITIPDMHNQIYAVSTERSLSAEGALSQSGKMLPRNSICVSCIGTAGLVCLVAEPSQTNQQINSIVPSVTTSPYYIYLLANTLSDTIQNLGSGGSTICNLNKGQFSAIEALIPSEKSMQEFDEIVKPLFESIHINQIENLRLAELRDTLLPRLMSDEVDVSAIQI